MKKKKNHDEVWALQKWLRPWASVYFTVGFKSRHKVLWLHDNSSSCVSVVISMLPLPLLEPDREAANASKTPSFA